MLKQLIQHKAQEIAKMESECNKLAQQMAEMTAERKFGEIASYAARIQEMAALIQQGNRDIEMMEQLMEMEG